MLPEATARRPLMSLPLETVRKRSIASKGAWMSPQDRSLSKAPGVLSPTMIPAFRTNADI
jgi:hypothetical protein